MGMDGDAQNITLTYDILLLDTIKKMRDCYAESNEEKYYKYFEVAIQLVMPHLEIDIKKGVEADFRKLREEEKRIKDTQANDQTKKLELMKLKDDFATAHRYYIMLVLTKVGIVKTSEEGLIDFKSVDIEDMKHVIRAGGGLPSAVERSGLNKEREVPGAK